MLRKQKKNEIGNCLGSEGRERIMCGGWLLMDVGFFWRIIGVVKWIIYTACFISVCIFKSHTTGWAVIVLPGMSSNRGQAISNHPVSSRVRSTVLLSSPCEWDWYPGYSARPKHSEDHRPVSTSSLFSQVPAYLSLINLVTGLHQKFDILFHIID